MPLTVSDNVEATQHYTDLQDYFNEHSLTGGAFDHITPMAVQAELLDKRCSTWPVQTYVDLLHGSRKAQLAARDVIDLASQDKVTPLRRNGNSDTSFAAAAREVIVTPLGMAKYQSLYVATVATGVGLAQVATGNKFTTKQAASIAPARVPGTALRKRGVLRLPRSMTNRELRTFEEVYDLSLLDTCIDAEGLAHEVACQIDRVLVSSSLVEFARLQETGLGRRMRLGMFASNTSRALSELTEQVQTDGLTGASAYHDLLDVVCRRYQKTIAAAKTGSRADANEVMLLKNSLAKLERWQTIRSDGQNELDEARDLLRSRGLGSMTLSRSAEVITIHNDVLDKADPEVAPDVVVGEMGKQEDVTHLVATDSVEVDDGQQDVVVPEAIEESTTEPVSEHMPVEAAVRPDDIWYDNHTPPEIEAEVIQLGWEVLPSGFNMDDMRQLIAEDPILNEPSVVIDWRRVEDLLNLKDLRDGKLYRSKPGDLGSHFVYFVAEFDTPVAKVAVADNPVFGNATYILAEHLIPGTWQELLKLPRQAIRELGGIKKVHVDQSTHLAKVVKTTNQLLQLPSI